MDKKNQKAIKQVHQQSTLKHKTRDANATSCIN